MLQKNDSMVSELSSDSSRLGFVLIDLVNPKVTSRDLALRCSGLVTKLATDDLFGQLNVVNNQMNLMINTVGRILETQHEKLHLLFQTTGGYETKTPRGVSDRRTVSYTAGLD